MCTLTLGGKTITTPALLPVVNPRHLTIPPREMEESFGLDALITNAYIIGREPELRERATSEGVHDLLDFGGFVMTDSGAFQAHVYGEIEVTNEEIVTLQRRMGTDLGTVLDIFSEPTDRRDVAGEAVAETLRRTKEALGLAGDMPLNATVQGSTYPDLRESCARDLSALDLDVVSVGGVVPMMESYRFADLVRVVMASKASLPPSMPVHLFGAGHPLIFPLIAAMGVDTFDSASYAKYAQEGRMLFPWGTERAANLEESPCSCPACREGETRDMTEEALARHNLHVCVAEVRRIREAIRHGSLWELVERRARAHPALLEALRELYAHADILERNQALSERSAMHYVGEETLQRPVVRRIRDRLLTRYVPPAREVCVVVDERPKPYWRHRPSELEAVLACAGTHLVVRSSLGPIPIELDEVHPVAQSIFPPSLPEAVMADAEEALQRFLEAAGYGNVVEWRGAESLGAMKASTRETRHIDMEAWRVRATADYQFGRGMADVLLDGSVELRRSKKTGRVRNVLVDGDHVLSMRSRDGLFTLKAAGARKLHDALEPPRMRVAVETETAEFNREGRNVFAKFVVEMDEDLRPGDEVLVVDGEDRLVAVGQARMNREDALSYQAGVAVRVREGLP